VQQGIIGMPNDKKLFIHIPKTGGISIRRNQKTNKHILKPPHSLVKEPYRLETKKMYSDYRMWWHWKCIDWPPQYINEYKTFAIIRNPWDRKASQYYYTLKRNYKEYNSFEEFLESRNQITIRNHMNPYMSWTTQYDYVVNHDRKITTDILRFENYDEDVNLYFNLSKNVKPSNVTGSNEGSYKDIYTPETIQIVADWYKKDIDYWGYDFDTGATRNYWNA